MAAAKKKQRQSTVGRGRALKAELEQKRKATAQTQQAEAEAAFVAGAPGATQPRRRGKKAKKVQRTRATQLNVRIDDELMATLRALAARRKANAVRPYLTRDIVELALVEWIEKADKRLRRDNREAAEALRQLADELAGD